RHMLVRIVRMRSANAQNAREMGTSPNQSALASGIRGFVFLYLVLGSMGLQLGTLISLAGVEIPIWPGVWAVLLTPAVGALLLRRFHRDSGTPSWWTVSGFLMFGLWAGGYFAIGALVDPARV